MPDVSRRRTIVEVPWHTLFRVVAVVALVWAFLKLWQLLLVVLVAVLLAVTLEPLVAWLERRNLPRWGATTIVSAAIVVLAAVFAWFTWSSLSDQFRYVAGHAADIRDQVLQRLPGWMRGAAGQLNLDNAESTIGPALVSFARSLGDAAIVIVLGFILTIYLLVEGRRTREWLVAFVPRGRRAKVQQTLAESETVIFGYVAGNIATSIFATIFVLVSLTVLHVPAALLLAIIAGLCDFVPVLGFALSSIPAIVLALTVSTRTALVVVLLYAVYHFIENYLIAPRVYGDRLKLSNVAVILAFAIGAALAGVIGAIVALPIAALYPSIERIWLHDRLGDEVVREHRAAERRSA